MHQQNFEVPTLNDFHVAEVDCNIIKQIELVNTFEELTEVL